MELRLRAAIDAFSRLHLVAPPRLQPPSPLYPARRLPHLHHPRTQLYAARCLSTTARRHQPPVTAAARQPEPDDDDDDDDDDDSASAEPPQSNPPSPPLRSHPAAPTDHSLDTLVDRALSLPKRPLHRTDPPPPAQPPRDTPASSADILEAAYHAWETKQPPSNSKSRPGMRKPAATAADEALMRAMDDSMRAILTGARGGGADAALSAEQARALRYQHRFPYPLGAALGRTVAVTERVELGRALWSLKGLVARNRVPFLERAQRFHERPGLKRKRLRSLRWRWRFKEGFQHVVARAKALQKAGW